MLKKSQAHEGLLVPPAPRQGRPEHNDHGLGEGASHGYVPSEMPRGREPGETDRAIHPMVQCCGSSNWQTKEGLWPTNGPIESPKEIVGQLLGTRNLHMFFYRPQHLLPQ
jgi:hypothetical protein